MVSRVPRFRHLTPQNTFVISTEFFLYPHEPLSLPRDTPILDPGHGKNVLCIGTPDLRTLGGVYLRCRSVLEGDRKGSGPMSVVVVVVPGTGTVPRPGRRRPLCLPTLK